MGVTGAAHHRTASVPPARRARETGAALARSGVRAVALGMVDNAGICRVKCVPVGRFAQAATAGVGLSPVFSIATMDDHFPPAPGVEGPAGDLRLVADPGATVRLASLPGWAWSPVDQHTQDGAVWPACGRSFLKRMVRELAAKGLTLQASFEHEFFVGRRVSADVAGSEEPDPIPAHLGPGYSANAFVDHAALGLALIDALEEQRIGVMQFHPEYAVGQFEVSVPHADALGAADTALVVRQTVRSVVRSFGFDVSFAPVVVLGSVGNGMHVHLSLWDAGKRNQFAGGRGAQGMSAKAEAFSAGVLRELAALTCITSPSVPSYERLQPQRWAGAYATWGVENREAALRFVPGSAASRARAANMELKSVDGAANPYLTIGAIIAAGLAGLDERLRLAEPTQIDPHALTARERKHRGIARLPASLGDAVSALEGSTVLTSAMGELLIDTFLATRRAEAQTFGAMDPADAVRAHRWRY